MARDKRDNSYRFLKEFWCLKIPLCLLPVPGWIILAVWANFERDENPDAYLNHFCPYCNSLLKSEMNTKQISFDLIIQRVLFPSILGMLGFVLFFVSFFLGVPKIFDWFESLI